MDQVVQDALILPVRTGEYKVIGLILLAVQGSTPLTYIRIGGILIYGYKELVTKMLLSNGARPNGPGVLEIV